MKTLYYKVEVTRVRYALFTDTTKTEKKIFTVVQSNSGNEDADMAQAARNAIEYWIEEERIIGAKYTMAEILEIAET